MTKEDVREEIENRIGGNHGEETSESEDDGTTEVAIFNLRCPECGSINGREPRPVNCPRIGQVCDECGELQNHELVRDSEVSEID